ncbi:MAG: sigma-70 family RNA polymerase sigma factor [Planctomycetes bacterium]|nr:sigma-70 family RNA polymerase sigma factor [Planctomycetota bacterium]
MDDTNDATLFARFLLGDESMFAALVSKYEQPLFNFLLRRLGNSALAQEAFQETFVRVYRSRHTWQKGRPFRPWLYTIALNVAWRTLARESRHRAHRLPDSDSSTGGEGPVPAATVPASSTETERRELSDRIRRAVDTLPEAQREVFVMVEVDGLTQPEIAEVLGVPLGTVKSRLHYAARALRSSLVDLMESPPSAVRPGGEE